MPPPTRSRLLGYWTGFAASVYVTTRLLLAAEAAFASPVARAFECTLVVAHTAAWGMAAALLLDESR